MARLCCWLWPPWHLGTQGSLRGEAGSAHRERSARRWPAYSHFSQDFAHQLPGFPGEGTGRARKRPQRRRLEISPPEMGLTSHHPTPSPLRPCPPPGPAGRRGRCAELRDAPVSAGTEQKGSASIALLRKKQKNKTKPAWAIEIQKQHLPLDRRTMFSRNVFCGATSPRRPPAMVILPTARDLGASGAASHRSRRPGAQPAKVLSSPRPMRPAAPERRGGD